MDPLSPVDVIADKLDLILRWVVVTPDMHRVHHSIQPTETNSNFGFNLSWWDRLFGTYRPEPSAGQEAMTIGIEQSHGRAGRACGRGEVHEAGQAPIIRSLQLGTSYSD
jgi:sterol desaturase/sphingolipid hydroxylase (fatty acid hydroxylase superfamily)